MDNTILALLEIDKQAALITSGITEEKKALSLANEQRIAEFDASILSDTEEKINKKRSELDKIIASEADALSRKTEEEIDGLRTLFDTAHDTIAGEIFEKITGHRWEA